MQSIGDTARDAPPLPARSGLDRFVELFDLGLDPASVAPDAMRRIRILGIATIAMVGVGVGYMAVHARLGLYALACANIATAGAAIANLAVLRVTRRPVPAAHAATALLALMVGFSAWSNGGFYDPSFAWYYLVPICAAIVLDTRGAAIWTLLTACLCLGFWSLHELGVALANQVPPEARGGMALWSRLSAILGTGLVGHGFVLAQRRAERELAVANSELSRESAYVQLLMHAAVAANEAVSLDTAMREAVVRICQSMGWEVGHVGVRSEHGTIVSSGFHFASDPESFAPVRAYALGAVYRPGEGLAGAVFATGRPWVVTDLLSLPESSAGYRVSFATGLRSAFALPVLVHDEVRAVLEFGSRQPAPGAARLVDVFAHIGRQLGRVAERTALQDRLRQSQKMEAVGQLAAGLAHEINNPMSYVRSNLHGLREEWDALRSKLAGTDESSRLDELQALIDESLEGVDRTIAIVKDVREFSRFGGASGADREEVELAELVEGALRVASTRARPGVAFERDYGAAPRVPCHANSIRQVLVNLIVNAVQAVGDAGRIRLSTGADAGTAFVRVEDDGPGMSADTRERLFDPFFTTKPVGEGTGLGLYVSYEIVRSHGGEIAVESEPGAGSSFEVRLPLAAGAQASRRPESV